MARERQGEAQQEKCIVCGGVVEINPYGYSPPVTDQPIMDTGFYRYGGHMEGYEDRMGYVCVGCIPSLEWNDEDCKTLAHDWMFDADDLVRLASVPA